MSEFPFPPATFRGKGWKKKKGQEHHRYTPPTCSNTHRETSAVLQNALDAGNPERPALPMQSPAVSRSRHLTVCDRVNECASAIVHDIRSFGYRNLTLETSSPASQSSAVASPGPDNACAPSTSPHAPHFHLTVASCRESMCTTAFMSFRVFAQTPLSMRSPSRLQALVSC